MEIRDRIIEGSAELFKIYGIRSVTMDSIAAHLGISKRTIYEVFSDKDELLTGVLKMLGEQEKEMIQKILDNSENAIVAIFKLIEINRNNFQSLSPAFHADLKKFHNEVLMKKCDMSDMPDYKNHMRIIERGINEKLFREDIDPDIVNRCLYALGKVILDQDLYPFDKFKRNDIVRNVFINYLRGISTDNGLKLILNMNTDADSYF
jgi:TetR/AcrR family transcriptional regulator, cholesterol catabolism regulator